MSLPLPSRDRSYQEAPCKTPQPQTHLNPARPSASTIKIPVALVSTVSQRSDLVCFLITISLNSRSATVSGLDLSAHVALKITLCLGSNVICQHTQVKSRKPDSCHLHVCIFIHLSVSLAIAS